MKKVITVSDYLKAVPLEAREKLVVIRDIVKKVAPKAEEKISWGRPMYYLKSPVMGLGAAKTHVAIYGMNGTSVSKHKVELKGLDVSKGTIRFPLDKKLPVTLIKKIIKLMFAQKKTWLHTKAKSSKVKK